MIRWGEVSRSDIQLSFPYIHTNPLLLSCLIIMSLNCFPPSRGDQFVRLKVVIPGPSQLTPRQKELLEEFDGRAPPAQLDDKDKDKADRNEPPSEKHKNGKETTEASSSSSNSVGMIGKAWKKLGELFSFSDATVRHMPQTI